MPATDSGPSTHRLGRYHLSDSLGGGPTGEVFRGKVYGIAGMDRDFAVKRFHPNFVTGSAAAAEVAVAAQLYGSLDHPKIAKLQELGVSGDQTFTAVEYVPGVDLAQLIDHEKLPLGAAARLVVEIGRAVGYAHRRSMTHLGLAPTNVICTDRGEIKVTDFGFLPSRLPRRPAEDVSLQARLCYLAPEQLEGAECSAATDVYQLGTMAFELMVGRKPYAGRSGVALANQILGGSVPESGLAIQFQKILSKAMARNPNDRYPDAGAFADAIEAALRSCTAEGTLDDVGRAVSEREVFLADSREAQASGTLSFPIPAPPKAGRAAALNVTTPPPLPSNPPSSLGRIKLKKKSVVVRRPAPPVIPQVPDEEIELLDSTIDVELLSDEENAPDTVPSMDAPVMEEGKRRESSGLLLGPAGTDAAAKRSQFIGGEANAHAKAHAARDTEEVTAASVDDAWDTGEVTVASVDAAWDAEEVTALSSMDALARDTEEVSAPSSMDALARDTEEVAAPLMDASKSPSGAVTATGAAVPTPPAAESPAAFPPPLEDVILTPPPLYGTPPGISIPNYLLYPGMAAVVALVAVLTFKLLAAGDPKRPGSEQNDLALVAALPVESDAAALIANTSDAAAPAANTSDAAAPLAKAADAAVLVAETADAAVLVATTADAASSEEPAVPEEPIAIPTPALSGDGLQIASNPAGAKVYLDGTLVGMTPVTLDASSDRHRLALIMPGYDLHTGEINGQGNFAFDLSEVVPPGGPAGIKVRCKEKNRYYVFVDDNAVGQLCPTERIGVFKGKHVVEIYDPITDSRRRFSAHVKETRLSLRVKVD